MSCEHHKVEIQVSGTISSWSLSSFIVYWTICSGFIQPMFLSCTSSNCFLHNTRRLGFLWRWICFLAQIQWVVLNYTPLGDCHLHFVGRHEYIFISISELNDIAWIDKHGAQWCKFVAGIMTWTKLCAKSAMWSSNQKFFGTPIWHLVLIKRSFPWTASIPLILLL